MPRNDSPEGGIVWPQPDPYEEERVALDNRLAQMRAELAQAAGLPLIEDHVQTLPDRVDPLLQNWPMNVPRPQHPGNWNTRVRDQERQDVTDAISHNYDSIADKGALFEYMDWLKSHIILDSGAAGMINDVLLHPQRGGPKNLRLVAFEPAFTHEEFVAKNRRFELDFLGLEPLAASQDDTDNNVPLDSGLRITEDGLYARYDFFDDGKYFWERHGGDVPIEPLAKVMRMEPEAFHAQINAYGVHPDYHDGRPIPLWSMVRADNYLFKVMPVEGDATQVTIGGIYELTAFGSYLLDEVLRAYASGAEAAKDT